MTTTPDPEQPEHDQAPAPIEFEAVNDTSSEPSVSPVLRPALPDWGVYLRPPEDGLEWLHPEDVEWAHELIPSQRIFRRSRWDGMYYWLHYGSQTVRVRPTLWLLVPPVDFDVGEQIELIAKHGVNDAGIYRIADIMFNPRLNQIEYYLRRDELVISRSFEREDLQALQLRHEKLRAGFYQHERPKSALPDDLELLDVGDLFDE